jgi:hypothetical protein
MKAQFLKIAGVKTEAEFYKKFPSEEAFMKKHGKEFKKTQLSNTISKAAGGLNIFDGMQGGVNSTSTTTTMVPEDKSTALSRQQQILQYGIGAQTIGKAKEAQNEGVTPVQPAPGQFDEGGSGMINEEGSGMYNSNSAGPLASSDFRKGYTGPEGAVNDPKKKKFDWNKVQPYVSAGLNVYGGIKSWEAEKKAAQAAKQARMVSDVALKASLTSPEKPQRKYVRPEDYITSGSEFYPVHGVGTNVLAKDGADITNRTYGPGETQNTYAPEDIYEDLGYEPLNDSNKLKSFAGGGVTPPSSFNTFMTGGGGTALASLAGAVSGNNAGSQIGGGLGSAAGMLIGGPLAGMAGNVLGTTVGGLLDPNAKQQKREQEKMQRNMNMMGIQQGTASIQANNASYMENGGYVSNDWTPQVISMFGDHSPEDVYDFAHEGMESLRTGGNVRQNNMFQQDQYALGGELKTHWGGTAETMSHNPYLPGSGETVMFRGKSHEERSPNGETGIGITYGGNPVEVERGEPMVELEEGGVVDPMTGEVKKSGVVFGNLKIPNQYIDLLGDKSAKGKKFKNYVAALSKGEATQNKLIEKSTKELNELEPTTIFDKLKLTALQANIDGANMKLKGFADKKINAASLQNAINDTAEENGFDADALAKGKVKQAKFGASFSKAQDGKDFSTYLPYIQDIIKAALENSESDPTAMLDNIDEEALSEGLRPIAKEGKTVSTSAETTTYPSVEAAKKAGYTKYNPKTKQWEKTIKKADGSTSQQAAAVALGAIPKGQKADKSSGLYGGITPAQFEAYKKKNAWYDKWDKFDPSNPSDLNDYKKSFNEKAKSIGSTSRILDDPDGTPKFGQQYYSANIDEQKGGKPAEETTVGVDVKEPVDTKEIPYKRSKFLDIAGQILPFLRPTDQMPLEGQQLYPEMFAMATNQVEPVQAQGYQPQLSTPYDISYQDQLNANQSDYRATQRAVGYNPAAMAQLNAQKYKANQNVLGEQFRANQAMKDKVYGENRNILNDAKLKNLAIYDQQYERQAKALSNTKATSQAAISSIADKYAQNKLENRTLGVMENMYNFRFDPSGRAINMNAPHQFNIGTVGAGQAGQKQTPVKDASGKLLYYQLEANDPVEEEEAENVEVKPIGEKKRNGSIVKAFKNF